jgi:hypothetical protein
MHRNGSIPDHRRHQHILSPSDHREKHISSQVLTHQSSLFGIERRLTNHTSINTEIRLQGEHELHAISRELDTVIKWRVSKPGPELKLNHSEQLIWKQNFSERPIEHISG